MSPTDDELMLAPMVRTMQIIVIAMVTGLVIFLGIALYLRAEPPPAAKPAAVPVANRGLPLNRLAVGFAAIAILMSITIPSIVVKNARGQFARGTWPPQSGFAAPIPPGPAGDSLRLAGLYQTTLIIGAAVLEGAAFFSLIAYLLEGQAMTLGMAILLILGLAAHFPSLERVQGWIDVQKELIFEEKQVGE